jgi:uncharacterized protein (DUF1501 family)
MNNNASRRHFLRSSAAVAASGATAPLALNLAAVASASAQAASNYKALVVVYLGGGNDHLNTLVPHDLASFNPYANARGALAVGRGDLLPLSTARNHEGRTAAFNPSLSQVQSLYNLRRLAAVASVGPLVAPTRLADIIGGRAALPPQLFSHLDQSNQWQSPESDGYGWGGRLGDVLAASNGRAAFTTISATGGHTLLLVGANTTFFTVSEAGAPSSFFEGSDAWNGILTGSAQRTNLLEQAYCQVHEQLRDGAAALADNMPPESQFPTPPGGGRNALSQQLLSVARSIAAHGALGLRRQVFWVELGGFDTHSGQNSRHPALLAQLDEALGYFDTLMGQLNLRDAVTLCTTSEFGRTLASNGDGTDHAWGSHHLVMGGAVRGGEIYGRLPVFEAGGPDFWDGALLPAASVEQYGATLARWMGVGSGMGLLTDVFPRLPRFDQTSLGFMG